MKKFLNKLTEVKNNFVQKTTMAYLGFKQKTFGIIAQNTGEGFVDSALKILISVVIGSLLLAGLYMLFKDSLLPELTKRIMSIFDYKG